MSRPPRSPLDLDPEVMRRIGYRAVDMAVDHLARMREEPVWRMLPRDEAEALLREPLPERGAPLEDLLVTLERDVLAHAGRVGHPRFLGFVPSAITFPSAVANFLTAAFNPFAGTWLESSGPSMVELTVIDWLREMVGLPEGTGGLLTSGGSAANLIAIVAARRAVLGDRIEGARVYFSDQTHSCVERALRIAGFPPRADVKLPSDPRGRLDPERVRSEIHADRKAGRQPFLVVANAGATNTGAVDPLAGLAETARKENVWLHVDAAYGGFAALAPEGREALAGIEGADSWVLDPHKWLYQPFECGSVLLRRPRELRDAFAVHPEYLQDVRLQDEEVNFADYGLQLTRSARALKLWLSLKHFGAGAYREAVARCLRLARLAGSILAAEPRFEILSPPQLGVVCFRLVREGADPAEIDALNRRALERVNASGEAFLSSTTLHGRFACRLCVLSHRTTEEDVRAVLEALLRAV